VTNNSSILDSSLRNDLDNNFKSGKSRMNKPRLNDSANKSLKTNGSSSNILKNNLKKVNQKTDEKPGHKKVNKSQYEISKIEADNKIKQRNQSKIKFPSESRNKTPALRDKIANTLTKNKVIEIPNEPVRNNSRKPVQKIKSFTSNKGKNSLTESASKEIEVHPIEKKITKTNEHKV
jgi:hypothetical protein